jgi:signal transduction histidine kinase
MCLIVRDRNREGMRTAHSNIDVNQYVPPLTAVNEQRGIKRPRWRYSAFGYLAVLPFLAVMISIWQMHLGLILPGACASLALIVVATLWGTQPAMIMLILLVSCLSYLIAAPGHWLPVNWLGVLQLLLSAIVGLLLIWITVGRKDIRTKALAAEENLRMRAKELETANQIKDRFISIASHELKTPVTTIRVQTQFMLRRLAKQQGMGIDKEFLMRSLQRIDEQTERLADLITDLLDTDRTQTHKVTLHRQSCDLNDICQKVIEDQRLLTERSITLEAPTWPIIAHIDPNRVAQVLINVISNALKYSPPISQVEVSIGQNSEHALIQVRDHGHGIAKDDLPRIFDTFYRTTDAQTSCTTGLGLGLAIAKEIIEQHAGRIWCKSEPGQGSTFFVELPLGEDT